MRVKLGIVKKYSLSSYCNNSITVDQHLLKQVAPATDMCLVKSSSSDLLLKYDSPST